MSEEQGVLEVKRLIRSIAMGCTYLLTYFQNSLTSSKVLSSMKEETRFFHDTQWTSIESYKAILEVFTLEV
jgi:hypothetical protein